MLPIAATSDPEPLVAWPNSVKSLARPTMPSKSEAISFPMSSRMLEVALVVAAAAAVALVTIWAWTAGEGVGVGVGEEVESPAS